MKKIFLAALLPWLCLAFLQAQDQPLPKASTADTTKNKVYAVWINGSIFKKRYLWDMTDSTITLGTKPYRPRFDLVTYPVEEVRWLKFRREKRIQRGIGHGFLIGAAIGFITGFASGDDDDDEYLQFTAEAKALTVSIFAGAFGAVVGGTIGAFKKKIPINGSRNTLAQQRKALEQYKRRL